MGRRRRSRSPKRTRTSRRPALQQRGRVQPVSAHQSRGDGRRNRYQPFDAPEIWHEPRNDGSLRVIEHWAGENYVHPVTAHEVLDRMDELPEEFREQVEVVQMSRMTRKRRLFPCYGLQWGVAVYLYPIEDSYEEVYVRPPRPQQRVEASMYGGRWVQDGSLWRLIWNEQSIRDFYLNNVLIHEIGHVCDDRNTRFTDRERYAEWFAIEYGYRPYRGR